jgi:hypothetical protein
MLRLLDELDEKYGPLSDDDIARGEEKWERLHGSSLRLIAERS